MDRKVYIEGFLALLRASGLEAQFREKFLLRHRDVDCSCIPLEEWLNNVIPKNYVDDGIWYCGEALWSSLDRIWQVRVDLLEKDEHKDELRRDYVWKVKIMESLCDSMKDFVTNFRWDAVGEDLTKMNDLLVAVVQIKKELLSDAGKGK